jgi:hypothetical protein
MGANDSTSGTSKSKGAAIGAVAPDVLRAALFYLATSLAGNTERRYGRDYHRPARQWPARWARQGTTEAEGDLVAFICGKIGGDREISRRASVRVTAMWRLFARRPDLLRMAAHPPSDGGMLRDETIALAAGLDLLVPPGSASPPRFDEDTFSAALATLEEVERLPH